MTETLLPCPFCGGQAGILTADMPFDYLFGVMCKDCRSRGDVYATEAEAIAAWNKRAEMSYEDALILLDELGLSERTCHEVMVDRFFRGCSECGYMWEYMYGIGKREHPNYCPNCGAKVMDE